MRKADRNILVTWIKDNKKLNISWCFGTGQLGERYSVSWKEDYHDQAASSKSFRRNETKSHK